ncbi:MAG: DUF309 domain-containing protein [Crenarchaeota archaeon]|nr:MAG: DUF309 domain-containing protein [Thermoproteota archaeon]RDJ33765.1 MAG: DUF309 domain-containing protein [Thermoproteota archaeon]RDJ37125.1 MAG: DUF309 domain-containing protein [Thermoproteota archaeon]RDJ37342.1 MAG: DUF309 domain-containing protein [Thermoproteota archaeon]
MERYMLHLQNSDYTPKDATTLLRKARELSHGMDVTVRDTRVSSKYLEYDVSIKKENLDTLVEKLSSLGKIDHAKHVTEESIKKEDAVKQGIFYFNNERFWECHEVLEGVWKNCFEGEKDLVQGVILIAAGLVHYQKNEDEICLSIFGRALDKLSKASGKYYDIDVDLIRKKISAMKNSGEISTFEI